MSSPESRKTPGYLNSRTTRIGIGLLILGSGPLLMIIMAAKLGLTRDPNPNPVGFGILAGLTFWPAIILLAIGISRTSRSRNRL